MALREELKNFGMGVGHVILGTGIAAGIDYVSFPLNGFSSPFADIAAGSGLGGGYNISKQKAGGVLASLIGLAGSTAPYVAEALQTGNFTRLGVSLAYKAVEYSVGALFGYILADIEKANK